MTPPEPYVEFGARITAPPPFNSSEGQFRGFVLKGQQAAIDTLVDEMLNGPANGKVTYLALSEYVVLLSGEFARVSSLAPPFDQRGFVSETQLSIWVPLLAGKGAGAGFVPERLCMAVPYIFVSNPMSYVGGREDFGYPKSMGQFTPSNGLGTDVHLKTFGGDFAPVNRGDWCPLLELTRQAAGAAAPAAPQSDLASLVLYLDGLAGTLASADQESAVAFLSELVQRMIAMETMQVFLKQFRDASSAGDACYRAVVEAPVKVSNVTVDPSLDEWAVTVHPLDTHPLQTDLGLATQPTCVTFELGMDMIAETGNVVAP